MTFTPHALAGAAIGLASGNPYLGFVGGVVSHHLLDMIPHFDQNTFRSRISCSPYLGIVADYNDMPFNKRDWLILFLDFAIAGILFLIVFATLPANLWPLIFSGALGGIMPDLIGSSPLWSTQLQKKFKAVKVYNKFHAFFHFTVPPPLIWLGVFTQILIVGFALLIIARG